MNNYNNLDKFFKERTTNIEISPSDKVWENIDNELFNNKGFFRKNALWILTILFLLIGSFGTWLIFSTTNEDVQSPIIVSNQQADNETALINLKSIESKREDPIIATNENISQQSLESEPTENSETTFSISEYNKSNISKSLIKAKSISLKKINNINNSITPNIIDNQKINSIEEYIERRKNVHMYTGVSASIAMTYYPATSDQSTWTTDLIYGLKLRKYYIETGIGYQKMKEQGVFQIDYITNDSIGYYHKVLGFELNPNNPNEITYKTQSTTVYDSIDHFILQSPIYSYGYLVIPVKIGYRFLTNKHFSLSVETGVIYSLLNKTYTPTVSYDNPESRLIGISNNTPIRVDHNFRLHLALRLNYKLTKSISANIQPEFTKFLNSVYKNNPDFNKTKPYTMGVRFGILFDF